MQINGRPKNKRLKSGKIVTKYIYDEKNDVDGSKYWRIIGRKRRKQSIT